MAIQLQHNESGVYEGTFFVAVTHLLTNLLSDGQIAGVTLTTRQNVKVHGDVQSIEPWPAFGYAEATAVVVTDYGTALVPLSNVIEVVL